MTFIFIDTNFFLKLAFKEPGSFRAYKLVKLAEEKKIVLCVPSFCIAEAYSSFVKKRKEQYQLKNAIEGFISQTMLMSHTKKVFEHYDKININIQSKLDKELKMIDSNITRVLKSAELIPHNADIHKNGIKFRSQLDLKDEPDAFIVSSIDWYIRKKISTNSDKIFLTEDASSIANIPEVKSLMSKRKTKIFKDYQSCLQYLKNKGIS